jgi:hypothetical protein
MAKAEERYLARSDESQQLIMSLVNQSEEGSLVRAQTLLTGLMIAEYIGQHTELEVFGLTLSSHN